MLFSLGELAPGGIHGGFRRAPQRLGFGHCVGHLGMTGLRLLHTHLHMFEQILPALLILLERLLARTPVHPLLLERLQTALQPLARIVQVLEFSFQATDLGRRCVKIGLRGMGGLRRRMMRLARRLECGFKLGETGAVGFQLRRQLSQARLYPGQLVQCLVAL